MILIFLMFFCTQALAQANNYTIARNNYSQAHELSNNEREYLEKAARIIKEVVKHEESENKESGDSDDSSIIETKTFDELDFISKKNQGIFYPKDIKLSYAAQAFLTYLSTAQTCDQTVLEKRRSVIEYLQKNPDFAQELLALMSLFDKSSEESFLNFSKKLTQAEKQKRNDLFLSRVGSNAAGLIRLLNSIDAGSSWHLMLLQWGFWLSKKIIPERVLRSLHDRFASVCCNYPAFFAASLTVPSFLITAGGAYLINRELFSPYHFKPFFRGDFTIKFTSGVLKSMALFTWIGLTIIPGCFYAWSDYNFVLKREKGLICAQKIFSAANRLDQLLAKHSDFTKNLFLKNSLHCLSAPSFDSKTAFVLDQFKNEKIRDHSFLKYWLGGRSMVLDKIIVDNPDIVQKRLFPVLASLGEIHTYIALSNQFKNYTVPEIKKDGISIQLKDFFHPNFPNFVKNSLDYIASDDQRFVFISGANGSGKSATARAILASLVANQTFGLISALQAKVSLFDKIYFFANLSDDLGVASKFQIELAKLKNLHEYLEKNQNKKTLLVMDEPLTTTDSAVAYQVLYKLFTFLKQYPNLAIISISNNSNLKDFKGVLHMGMEVKKEDDGTFKPTYRCKKGHAYMSDVMAQFAKLFGEKFVQCQEQEQVSS